MFIEALKRVDIALPAFDDEAVLWGDPSPEATVARLQAFGIGEIVVKNGPNSALVAAGAAIKNSCRCPKSWCRSMPPRPATVSMPAISRHGFPAARRREAAGAAHRLAGNVIRHPGALLPRTPRRCIEHAPLRRLTQWRAAAAQAVEDRFRAVMEKSRVFWSNASPASGIM